MAQQSLGGAVVESSEESTAPKAGPDAENESGGGDDADPYEFIKYLDVNRLCLIRALAGTFDTVEEAEKYIEAEEKRWARTEVLRILRKKRERLDSGTPAAPTAK